MSTNLLLEQKAKPWANVRTNTLINDGDASIGGLLQLPLGAHAGWVLTSDAEGTGSWAPGGGSEGGDVIGPDTSLNASIASFADGTGKTIKDSLVTITTTNVPNDSVNVPGNVSCQGTVGASLVFGTNVEAGTRVTSEELLVTSIATIANAGFSGTTRCFGPLTVAGDAGCTSVTTQEINITSGAATGKVLTCTSSDGTAIWSTPATPSLLPVNFALFNSSAPTTIFNNTTGGPVALNCCGVARITPNSEWAATGDPTQGLLNGNNRPNAYYLVTAHVPIEFLTTVVGNGDQCWCAITRNGAVVGTWAAAAMQKGGALFGAITLTCTYLGQFVVGDTIGVQGRSNAQTTNLAPAVLYSLNGTPTTIQCSGVNMSIVELV
jgi:hypothetical protein